MYGQINAKYFNVEKINKDQLLKYSSRKQIEIEIINKYQNYNMYKLLTKYSILTLSLFGLFFISSPKVEASLSMGNDFNIDPNNIVLSFADASNGISSFVIKNLPKEVTLKIGSPSLNRTITIPKRKRTENKENRQKSLLIKFSFCTLLII